MRKGNLSSPLATYFSWEAYETNLTTEIIAGITTYISLAYIFIVNPAILSKSGLDPSAVLLATAVASGAATLVMGAVARLPFAVAPGLEMNGFFAFVVCGTLGMTWQQGLGTVFYSGILCVVMTWLPVRKRVIDAIPPGLKKCIATSVGCFVATIGLFIANILVFKDGLIDFAALNLKSFATAQSFIMFTGFLIAVALGSRRARFPGGMLVAIVVGAILCGIWGIGAPDIADLNANPF